MKVLITGHHGFLGRHFHDALAEEHHVVGFDLHPPASSEPDLAVDVRDWARWDDTHYDLVIHAAAHVGGRTDIDGRPCYLGAVNQQIDGALFEWALRTRPGRVVYFSSSAAYPTALQSQWTRHPLRESDIDLQAPGNPDGSYGWTKLTGERLAAHATAEGLAVHVFRPFSGYGSDQGEEYPFGAFAGRARRREDPFTIWGDGTQVRDWIHVDDIVGAVLAAVDQDVRGPINLGTCRPTSFNQLAQLVTAQAGYSPEFEHRLDAPTGVAYRVADAFAMLDFYEPKVRLEEGIRRALA